MLWRLSGCKLPGADLTCPGFRQLIIEVPAVGNLVKRQPGLQESIQVFGSGRNRFLQRDMGLHALLTMVVHLAPYVSFCHQRRRQKDCLNFPGLNGMPASADCGTSSADQAQPTIDVALKYIAHRPPPAGRDLDRVIACGGEVSRGRMFQPDPELAPWLPQVFYQLTADSRHGI